MDCCFLRMLAVLLCMHHLYVTSVPRTIEDKQNVINIVMNANTNNSLSAQQAQRNEQSMLSIARDGIATAWRAVKDSRRAIILGAIAVSYASVLLYFVRGRFLIHDSRAWHAWRSELSLEELLALPHKKLYEHLRLSMQERYHTPHASIVMNLLDFFNETTHELVVLRGYHAIGSRLARIWLAPAFFVTSNSLRMADEKIKRLLHMRTVIATELEPDDVLKRLRLINCSTLRSQALRPGA